MESVTFNFNKEAILKAALTPSLQDWSGFFEFLRYQQYQKLAGAPSEEQRIAIQQSVKGIYHIESLIKQMIELKKFS